MGYYVLLYDEDIDDGVYLVENENGLGFKLFEYYQCKSLKQYFEEPAEMGMSKDDPGWRELYDFIWNDSDLLIVSEEFKQFLQNEDCGEVEFLSINIKDQRDKVVKQSFYLVNLLESVDYIDENKSDIEYNSINPDRMNGISKLVLNLNSIPPDRSLFRNKKKGDTYIVSEVLKQKIEQQGLEGMVFIPVDEYGSAMY